MAIDPRWLIYLPPTMAPTATSVRPDILEHPTEAFAAYRRDGIVPVICEEKHMGSRAIVIVCRDTEVALRRFKIDDPIGGTIYTRTGRAFFADPAWQAKVIERTRAAVSAAGLWAALDTDWLALDTELLPWSAKAEDLLRSQYAAVGASGHAMTARASERLAGALHRGIDVSDLAHRTEERTLAVDRFVDACRQYCWSVEEPDDLQVAPFVVLAAEGALLAERDHGWHMSIAERLVAAETGSSARLGTSPSTSTTQRAKQLRSPGGSSSWGTAAKAWSSSRWSRSSPASVVSSSPASSAEDPSTSCPTTSNGSATATSARSDHSRSGSSRSASKPSSASSPANPSTASTSASSASSPWRANLSTRGSDGAG